MALISEVSSSRELYRLICKESLHLRSGIGRDDALIRQLALSLGLDSKKSIPNQLESKNIGIEDFIQTFFEIAEPFAQMLNNIYAVMQRYGARSSFRSISMKFSFDKVCRELEFDLEQFREWQAVYQQAQGTLTTRWWTNNDIGKL
jgi:hypothetical protein